MARKPRLGWRLLFRTALTLSFRDARAGELTTLWVAVVLAVAALTSVAFVADRMHAGLDREARQMLGGDLRIRADHPIDPALLAEARVRGLRIASTAEFPSMATGPSASGSASEAIGAASMSAATEPMDPTAATEPPPSRLVAVKSVSENYPLRGTVTLAPAPNAPASADYDAQRGPAAGTVWVDAPLLDALNAKVGGAVQLGTRTLRITAVIVREPDRGFSFINFSPRVMMAASDLASTGLIGRGSRVTYRALLAGPDLAQADAFGAWARQTIDRDGIRGTTVETLQAGQPQLRQTLDRADHFLRLVALLTSLLCAVAIALAAQRFARRHVDGCAVLRCLGASERLLRGVFLIELAGLGLAASVVGGLLGLAGHAVLLHWLGGLIRVSLPWPSMWPLLQGVVAALVLLLGFGLPALYPLTRVPPVRVLRRDGAGLAGVFASDAERAAGQSGWRAAWHRVYALRGYAIGLLLYGGLLIWAAGALRLGLIVAAGFLIGVGGFALCGRGLLRLLAVWARKPGALGFGWRYAVASLERRSAASTLQITALGVALMCLLLLSMTRSDLIAGWRQSTPADAPNRFVIDIQPDQAAEVAQRLTASGIAASPPAPMIRGRLTARDGKPVSPDQFADTRVKRLVDREFNLSYRMTLPDDNRLEAGAWYGPTGSPKPQISIEAGLARDLGIHLNDMLTFDVAGQSITAPVTSIRRLDWGTMQVNFFVLMPPDALRDFPATFITSFHLRPDQQSALDGMVRAMPSLTIIDTAALLAQIQRMLDQVIAAVQFLFLFTLAAGAVVLYAALAGTRDERAHESALLRALGASRRQVQAVQWTEFVVVGVMAGAMAAIGAEAVGWTLAVRVFSFAFTLNPMLLLTGIVAGLVCAVAGGWWSLRSVLRRPVLVTLRGG
ncbi:FtsX-like permease family protein [Robbsia sp. KACC 23696]|uniref:ABC transporter permease n=1 Tax=Robbsia sp. KACC 23696 TaxID=3149231 RepID=UPI00325A52CE